MAEKEPSTKPGVSPDWLVRGVLTRVGDMFDRLTGRGWKPSSTLATSELIERLKALLDTEARDEKPGCKFVPHNIKLKMQWDKFSTDSEEGMRKLEAELLAAAIDHINDKRYYTHAPLSLEVKPDYFTPGVRLLVSFDKFSDEGHEAGVNLSVPGTSQTAIVEDAAVPHKAQVSFTAAYSLNGIEKVKTLVFAQGRRLSVGRTKENDLSIDDPSISKIHASLTVDTEGRMVAADTGSTNGTFIAGERIAYGKTAVVGENETVKFGAVEVAFKSEQIPRPDAAPNEPEKTEAFRPPEFEFTTRMETVAPLAENSERPAGEPPAPTQPSIPLEQLASTQPAIQVEPSVLDETGEGDPA